MPTEGGEEVPEDGGDLTPTAIVQLIFDIVDKDGDGIMTLEEFKAAMPDLTEYGGTSRKELREFYWAADTIDERD